MARALVLVAGAEGAQLLLLGDVVLSWRRLVRHLAELVRDVPHVHVLRSCRGRSPAMGSWACSWCGPGRYTRARTPRPDGRRLLSYPLALYRLYLLRVHGAFDGRFLRWCFSVTLAFTTRRALLRLRWRRPLRPRNLPREGLPRRSCLLACGCRRRACAAALFAFALAFASRRWLRCLDFSDVAGAEHAYASGLAGGVGVQHGGDARVHSRGEPPFWRSVARLLGRYE